MINMLAIIGPAPMAPMASVAPMAPDFGAIRYNTVLAYGAIPYRTVHVIYSEDESGIDVPVTYGTVRYRCRTTRCNIRHICKTTCLHGLGTGRKII